MKSGRFLILAIAVIGQRGMTAQALSADAREVCVPRTFSDSEGHVLPYRLLTPANYDKAKAYPLVLFLHGAGERGDDNVAQLIHGMNDFAKDENRLKYPCFVVAPQCPKEKKWAEVGKTAEPHTMSKAPTEEMQLVLGALAALQKEFNIDDRRLYVTGLSMGGYGTWDLLQRYPERFAAAVPICGGGDVNYASRLVRIPIWAFHGSEDQAVPPERSREMIAAIKEAGGKPLYTEYEGVPHNSWAATYADPKMMEWLFAQRLPKPQGQ